jgi:hypothetical protein
MEEVNTYGITIVNIKHNPQVTYDLYMGRVNKWLGLEQSKWANPFPMKNEGQRPIVLEQYRQHILSCPELITNLSELKGKTLACYCAPKKCHCNILI